MSRKPADWDDGRTVADMSGVEGPSLIRPRKKDTSVTDGQSPYTPQERRWAALGALKAALLLALVYLAGLALVIGILLWIWT